MTPAFAYLRVSGKGQIDGDGFPRQRDAIKKYAAANGYRIVRWFEERGVSGTIEALDRPGWNAMMSELLANGTRTVIVERLDRVARTIRVQETAVAELQGAGFELISVHEPDLMSEDPDRVMIRQILGSVAQRDKSAIVLKLKAARARKKAATGRCEGRKPYGTHPGEQETLDRILSMHAAGTNYFHIAETLNAEGIKPRQGEKWHPYAISRIVARSVKARKTSAQ